MNIIVSMLVIIGLLFGGSAAVSAAQDDLPNEPLYQIKLMSENVNLWLVHDPIAQIEMLMQQAQTRTEEIAALTLSGITPPAELTIRTQERIQRALQLTANLDDATHTATLQRIRTRMQAQERLMIQLHDGTCPECEPILQQTRDMLRTQLRQIDSSLMDPDTFQNHNQNQVRTTLTPQTTDNTIPQGTYTPVLDGTAQQNGDGNLASGTPMPQNNTTNQGSNGQQNGENNGSGGQNGDDSGKGNGPMPGSGGQGGKP